MGDQFGRRAAVRRRAVRVCLESGRHDDSPAFHLPAVRQQDPEAMLVTLDARDIRLIHVRNGALLKPQAIPNERLDRRRIGRVGSRRRAD